MSLFSFLRSLRPRLQQPKTFLYVFSLSAGTELIALTLLFNKLTGVYGLLAILTGYSLSATQLSAYLYNLAVIVVLAICIPHIRRETPLPNLVLAWVYALDTLANAAYTATFAVSWYFAANAAKAHAAPASATTKNAAVAAVAAVAAKATATAVSTAVAAAVAAAAVRAVPTLAAGGEAETATATEEVPVDYTAAADTDAEAMAAMTKASPVETAADGVADAVTPTATGATPAASSAVPTAGSGGWMGAHETSASLTLIIIVTVVRFYFSFIIIAHSRNALRRYSELVADRAVANDAAAGDGNNNNSNNNNRNGESSTGEYDEDNDIDDEEAGLKTGSRSARSRRRHRRSRSTKTTYTGNNRNPFAPGMPAGDGWRGRLGRALVSVGRSYWLGRRQDDEWARDISSRFK